MALNVQLRTDNDELITLNLFEIEKIKIVCLKAYHKFITQQKQ